MVKILIYFFLPGNDYNHVIFDEVYTFYWLINAMCYEKVNAVGSLDTGFLKQTEDTKISC
jgi:hypothetical protein